jgi:hypothetical protein
MVMPSSRTASVVAARSSRPRRLAQNSNENSPILGAVHDEFARSVKVVAGVGFLLGNACRGSRRIWRR